jgi:hypothetical protein
MGEAQLKEDDEGRRLFQKLMLFSGLKYTKALMYTLILFLTILLFTSPSFIFITAFLPPHLYRSSFYFKCNTTEMLGQILKNILYHLTANMPSSKDILVKEMRMLIQPLK